MQMVMTTVVELAGDRASARSTIREIGAAKDRASGLDSYGFYHDTLVRTGEGWRFAARRFQPVHLNTAPFPGQLVSPPA